MKKVQACDVHAEDSYGEIIDQPCNPRTTLKQAKNEFLRESSAIRKPCRNGILGNESGAASLLVD
jgi:hypothetical protein